MVAVPDIDLDFPREIREKLIVRVTERWGREHAALVASFATYRSRGAIRDVGKALGLPFARARAACARDRRLGCDAYRRRARRHAGQAHRAALGCFPHADARDRRPAAPHQPAPRRHGHLDSPADRSRAGAARGDGRPADLPVGQGQLRRRGLPEDRPARARDAVGGRGCDRPHRAAARRDDRPLADPAHRRRRLRGDPAGGHGRRLPDREPRADAEPPADAPRESRRPDRAGGARPARARSRARPCTRTSSTVSDCARIRRSEPAGRARVAARGSARHARRRRLPGPGARRRDGGRRLLDRRGRGPEARDEPQAQRGGDRGVPSALRRGLPRQRHRRDDGARDLRQARRLRGLRLPEVARGSVRRCSPTSRPGCAGTTPPSSSAR